jgi:hypothetical protein
LPDDLRKRLVGYDLCGDDGHCSIRYSTGASEVVVVHSPCDTCDLQARVIQKSRDGWGDKTSDIMAAAAEAAAGAAMEPGSTMIPAPETEEIRAARRTRQRDAMAKGQVEVRDVNRRQVYVDGSPVGDPF